MVSADGKIKGNAMSEMIERVAKAIFFQGGEQDDEMWEHMQPHLREMAIDQARSAISAMRDPSFEMMQAMYEAMFVDKWDGSQAPMIGAGFDAAIDSALSKANGEDKPS